LEFLQIPLKQWYLGNTKLKIPPKTALPETSDRIPPGFSEPLLNEKAAAQFLGISRMTLLRRRNEGKIKFCRDGLRVLYSKERHLIPYLEEREQGIEEG
jgi:hypothetical protein